MTDATRQVWRDRVNRIGIWVISTITASVVFSLTVGFILQNSADVTATRADALKLLSRAGFAARAGYSPQIEWSSSRRAEINGEMSSILFDLDGRLPTDLWTCLGGIVDDAKTAPFETITDPSRSIALFEQRHARIKHALDHWRHVQSYRFGYFRTELECRP